MDDKRLVKLVKNEKPNISRIPERWRESWTSTLQKDADKIQNMVLQEEEEEEEEEWTLEKSSSSGINEMESRH